MDITALEIIGKQLVLKNASGLIVGFCPLARVCAHASESLPDVLYISDSNRNAAGHKYPVVASEVSSPAVGTVQGLLAWLADAQRDAIASTDVAVTRQPLAVTAYPAWIPRSVNRGSATVTLPLAGTAYAIQSLRIRAGQAGRLAVSGVSVIATSNDSLLWEVLIDPVFGTAAYTAVAGSIAETATLAAANPVTAKNVRAASGYVYKNSQASTKLGQSADLSAGSTAVLAVTPLTSNLVLSASLSWLETN